MAVNTPVDVDTHTLIGSVTRTEVTTSTGEWLMRQNNGMVWILPSHLQHGWPFTILYTHPLLGVSTANPQSPKWSIFHLPPPPTFTTMSTTILPHAPRTWVDLPLSWRLHAVETVRVGRRMDGRSRGRGDDEAFPRHYQICVWQFGVRTGRAARPTPVAFAAGRGR